VSLPSVPQDIVKYIQEAAQGTKLPESVVAAQNYAESGYGTNLGPSSAGAEGPWQFEPRTYTGLGFSASTINDWSDSTSAYVKYMNQLLAQEGGNVRDALAAYNAGPDNLSAGYGYADSILSQAGQSSQITVNTTSSDQSGTSSSLNPLSGVSGLVSSVTQIAGVFKDLDTIVLDILNPSFWLRIGAFLAGSFFLFAGIWCLIHASDNTPLVPQNLPMVVPV
jgi:Transglycosylase SLT domain